jgi:sugar lactone lactonase YvrE
MGHFSRRAIVIAAAALLALPAAAQAEDADADAAATRPILQRLITTVAGYDIGDGGPIQDAWVSAVHDPIVDPAGNLFFTDGAYHRIRRVDAHSGVTTTVVGNGIAAHDVPDAPQPLNVAIGQPLGMAMDSARNLIFADFGNHRIRYVNRSNQPITAYGVTIPARSIANIAGDGFETADEDGRYNGDNKPATKASLSFPRTITLDAAQNVYFDDIHNFRVRKVNRATGIITTVAGNGELDFEHSGDGGQATDASLLFPSGVAFDHQGRMVIAEFSGRIRRVSKEGIITTIAGAGEPFEDGFSGDGGPAKQAKLGNNPKCILFDDDGSLLFTDPGNRRIRRIDPSGIITTVVGSGYADPFTDDAAYSVTEDGAHPLQARLRFPGCFAFSDRGVYLADDGNAALRLVHPGSDGLLNADPSERITDVSTVGGPRLSDPFKIDVDDAGNVITSQNVRARIMRVKPDGAVEALVGTGVIPWSIDGPGGDARDNLGDGGPAINATVNVAAGVEVAPNGDLYIADMSTRRIRRVVADGGVVSPQSRIETVVPLPFSPDAVAFGDIHHLYTADFGHNRVWSIDTVSGERTLVAGNGRDAYSGDGGQAVDAAVSGPFDVALDAAHKTLFIPMVGFGVVRAVDLATGTISTVARVTFIAGGEQQQGEPVQIDVLANRYLFVVDGFGGRVWRFDLRDQTHAGTIVAGTEFDDDPGFTGDRIPGNASQLTEPYGVAVGPGGKVFVADGRQNRIRRLGLVDILPGVFPNVLPASGEVPVAFLSDYAFDATTLVPSSIRVAGAPALHTSQADVDGDGRIDLVAIVDRAAMTVPPGFGEVATSARGPGGRVFNDADWTSAPG